MDFLKRYKLLIALLISGVLAFLVLHKPVDRRTAFETKLQRVLSQIPSTSKQLDTLPKADRPDMAALQNFVETLDPALGYVPLKRQYTAYERTKEMNESSRSASNIQWEGTRAEMGGRTRSLMFDPNDAENKRVFAGAVTGGLWVIDNITDLSDDWQPIGDFYANMAISSLTFDPTNTQVFYAGTGEAQTARIIYRESSGLGMGIFKSVDGGQNWELLPSTADFDYVTDVEVRVEDGVGVLYAAVVSGTYQGEEHQSQPSDGLYRSEDGGLNWEQVMPIIPGTEDKPYAPAMIEIAANNRIFVGTMENLQRNGGATILWSDEGSAGSWTTFTDYNTSISGESYYNIPARTIIAAAPSDPDILYAQFAAGYLNAENGFYHYRGRYMAKSTNGGLTWSPVNRPSNDWSTLAWHAFVLEVQPDNPNAVFTGGLDLWKTMNGGQSWTKLSDWSLMYYGGGDEYVHADQHLIAFRPGDPTKALFASDGGVFMSANAHVAVPIFIERNQNYNTLQFYSADIKPTAGSTDFVGGLQDNGSLLYNDNSLDINDMISGGDGAYTFWDQNESNIYITSIYYNRYYFFKNNNQNDYIDGGCGTFVSPADYDSRLNILYANAVDFLGNYPGRIYRVTNVGGNVSGSLVDLGTLNAVPFSHICVSRHSPTGASTLFVGTASGRLYKVTNANSFAQTTEIGSEDFPTANVSAVSVGGSEDTLLVSFSNYGVSSIWMTTDGGQSWLEKEGNLPDMPVRWSMLHPQNSGQAMLATETGIWTTNMLLDDETTWYPANEGMANVRVDMLRWRESDQTVIAASHGRGVFTGQWDVDVYTSVSALNRDLNEVLVAPNPVHDVLNIAIQNSSTKAVHIQIMDIQGRNVMTLTDQTTIDGKLTIGVRELIPGNYVLKISGQNITASARFAKQ